MADFLRFFVALAVNLVDIKLHWSARLGFGQGDAGLALIFAAAIFVRNLAHFIGFKEQDLCHAFIGVDFGGQGRGIGKLQCDMALPILAQMA